MRSTKVVLQRFCPHSDYLTPETCPTCLDDCENEDDAAIYRGELFSLFLAVLPETNDTQVSLLRAKELWNAFDNFFWETRGDPV